MSSRKVTVLGLGKLIEGTEDEVKVIVDEIYGRQAAEIKEEVKEVEITEPPVEETEDPSALARDIPEINETIVEDIPNEEPLDETLITLDPTERTKDKWIEFATTNGIDVNNTLNKTDLVKEIEIALNA